MPRVVGKVEGRGNGIKTVLVNIKDVALSLNRKAPEVTKFFGTELGAQTTYANDTDRAVVNGAHTDQDLQQKLSTYIEKFVLCANCHLPETQYKIKDGIISQKCLACGHKGSCDMTHKLTTFILAQHKKDKADAKAAGGGKEEKDKKSKKDKSGGASTPTSAASGGADDGGGKAAAGGEAGGGAKKKKDKGEEGSSKKSKAKKTFFDGEEGGGEGEEAGVAEEESDSAAVGQ